MWSADWGVSFPHRDTLRFVVGHRSTQMRTDVSLHALSAIDAALRVNF